MEQQWGAEQLQLATKLSLVDAYPEPITFIGGMDISFVKGDPVTACACFVVLTFPALDVVYQRCKIVQLTAPYISGFLAFREVPALQALMDELRYEAPHLLPSVIMVDGNGTLHPKRFGLACHLGVVLDMPTIGVAKTLMSGNGLPFEKEVRKTIAPGKGSRLPLMNGASELCGYALIPTADVQRPIYVSGGHRVSLDTATQLVLQCCKFRIPEPTRMADFLSRQELTRQGYNAAE